MNLLRCTIGRAASSGLGQNPPPTFATAMEELASTADAKHTTAMNPSD
jgi:hypothetical protein